MVEVAAQTTTPKRRDDHLVWNRPVCRPVWTKPHPFTVITNGTFRQVIHPVLPLLTTRSRHPPICALGDRSPRTVKMSPPLGMPGYTPHQATVSRAKDGEAVIAQVPGRASGHGRHGGHGENTAAKGGGRSAAQNEHGQTSLVQEKGYIEIATLLEEAEGRRTVPSSQRRLSLPRLFSGGSTAGPTRGTRSTRTRWGTTFLGVCACMCVLRAGGAECGGKNGVVHMGCAERAGKV